MDDDQFASVIAQAARLSDDERIPFLEKSGMSEDEISEAMDVLEALGDADDAAINNIFDKEPEDASERVASDMADEDETNVSVTEEDSDSDGDTDKVTIEKEDSEDDTPLTPEQEAIIQKYLSADSEDGPSNEEEDKPHDENSTNSIAKHLSGLRGPGME